MNATQEESKTQSAVWQVAWIHVDGHGVAVPRNLLLCQASKDTWKGKNSHPVVGPE